MDIMEIMEIYPAKYLQNCGKCYKKKCNNMAYTLNMRGWRSQNSNSRKRIIFSENHINYRIKQRTTSNKQQGIQQIDVDQCWEKCSFYRTSQDYKKLFKNYKVGRIKSSGSRCFGSSAKSSPILFHHIIIKLNNHYGDKMGCSRTWLK